MRTKAFSACLCLLLLTACGQEDRTAVVRNGFWGDNRISPISSAVDTWTGCFSGTQSWVTEYDKKDNATVHFSCRLTPEAAGGLLIPMKSLNTLAARHVGDQAEFTSVYAKNLVSASDVKNVFMKLSFPVKDSRNFHADTAKPVFTAEWADGTTLSIGKINTENMVNAMFHLPTYRDQRGKPRNLSLYDEFSKAVPDLLDRYFKSKKVNFSTLAIEQDGKTYKNLADNNGRPAAIQFPYYKVTRENVAEVVNTLLIPNIYQCNRWYDSLLKGLLSTSPKLAEYQAFSSLCHMDPRMEPGYSTTTRVGYEVVSDHQYVLARRFMYQLHNNIVSEETCDSDYWSAAYEVVQEFGNKEARSRADRETDIWVRKCLTRTSENGYHFLRKAALFHEASPYICSSGIIDSMLELMQTVHLSERDMAFVERKFKTIQQKCSELPAIEGIGMSAEPRDWRNPIGVTDDAALQAVAATIDNYVSRFFCRDTSAYSQCRNREHIELLKSNEFAAFKRLSSAAPEKYTQIEDLVCGELGFCSYGILSDVYFADGARAVAAQAASKAKAQETAKAAAVTQTADKAKLPAKAAAVQPAGKPRDEGGAKTGAAQSADKTKAQQAAKPAAARPASQAKTPEPVKAAAQPAGKAKTQDAAKAAAGALPADKARADETKAPPSKQADKAKPAGAGKAEKAALPATQAPSGAAPKQKPSAREQGSGAQGKPAAASPAAKPADKADGKPAEAEKSSKK